MEDAACGWIRLTSTNPQGGLERPKEILPGDNVYDSFQDNQHNEHEPDRLSGEPSSDAVYVSVTLW